MLTFAQDVCWSSAASAQSLVEARPATQERLRDDFFAQEFRALREGLLQEFRAVTSHATSRGAKTRPTRTTGPDRSCGPARCRCGPRCRARRSALQERSRERRERLVLRLGERHVVAALELDADREIVAALAALPRRDARVPRALVAAARTATSVAVAADQIVRRDLEPLDLAEVRMRRSDRGGP